MKCKNSRRLIALMFTLMFVLSFTTIAFATTSADADIQSSPVVPQTNKALVPYGTFTTLVMFEPEERTGVKSFSMTVGHSCQGKVMFNGFYTNGASGTMQIQLDEIHGNYSNHVTFQMNRTSTVLELGTLPAGTYNVRLWPNLVSTQYFCSGQVYSLNY